MALALSGRLLTRGALRSENDGLPNGKSAKKCKMVMLRNGLKKFRVVERIKSVYKL